MHDVTTEALLILNKKSFQDNGRRTMVMLSNEAVAIVREGSRDLIPKSGDALLAISITIFV